MGFGGAGCGGLGFGGFGGVGFVFRVGVSGLGLRCILIAGPSVGTLDMKPVSDRNLKNGAIPLRFGGYSGSLTLNPKT